MDVSDIQHACISTNKSIRTENWCELIGYSLSEIHFAVEDK